MKEEVKKKTWKITFIFNDFSQTITNELKREIVGKLFGKRNIIKKYSTLNIISK